MTSSKRQKNGCPALRPPRTGFTLLELLIVIAIIMVLLGIGIGVFIRLRRGYAKTALQQKISLVLREARSDAAAGAGSFVLLRDAGDYETEPGVKAIASLQVFSWDPVECWHCENTVGPTTIVGAAGNKGALYGVEYSEGLYGQALRLVAEPETIYPDPYDEDFRLDGKGRMPYVSKSGANRIEPSYVSIEPSPDFDSDLGLMIELFVYIEKLPLAGMGYIIERPGSYELVVDPDGYLEGATPQKDAFVDSTIRLFPGRWYKLSFKFDRHSYELRVEDMVVGRLEINSDMLNAWSREAVSAEDDYTGPLRDCEPEAPFYIGNTKGGFTGKVDEITVYRLAPGDEVTPKPVADVFFTDRLGLQAIHFLPDGRLDPRAHDGPVALWFEADGMEYPVLTSRLGEILLPDPVETGEASSVMAPE